MKTTKLITVLIALLISSNMTSFSKEKSNLKTTIFNVNTHCESCKEKIEKNIAFEKGVKDMQVDLEKKTVSITYKADKNSDEALITAFTKLGYEASVKPSGCCPNSAKKDCSKRKEKTADCKDKKGDCKKGSAKSCCESTTEKKCCDKK